VPSRRERGSWEGDIAARPRSSGAEVDENGLATMRPYAGTGHAGKDAFRLAGRREIHNAPPAESRSQGIIGGTRYGSRVILPPKGTNVRTRVPTAVTVKPKTTSGSGSSQKQNE
jgi:hypothetical protein